MDAQHLVDLVADGEHRVQRRHRFLEDHRHAGAAQVPQPGARGSQHILAVEQDRAGGRHQDLFGGRSPMTVNAVTDLPEPELADDADDLALPHGERDVLDGVRAIGAGGQPDGETAEVEDGRARRPSAPRHLGVEGVAQRVAEHVHGEHGQGEEDAGEEDVVRVDAEQRSAPRP